MSNHAAPRTLAAWRRDLGALGDTLRDEAAYAWAHVRLSLGFGPKEAEGNAPRYIIEDVGAYSVVRDLVDRVEYPFGGREVADWAVEYLQAGGELFAVPIYTSRERLGGEAV